MDLSKYNIEKLIVKSNAHMTKFEKSFARFDLLLGGVSLVISIFTTNPLFIGATIGFFSIPICNYTTSAINRLHAGKKLRGIVKELEQNGIHTTKLKLQKATTFTTRNYEEEKATDCFGISEVQTVAFQDNYGQLKALRQIRTELLRQPYRYVDCLRDSLKEVKCESIDKQYTELVKDSGKVKELLLENKKRS